MNPICFTSDIFSPVSLSVPCSSVQCRPCISCSDNVNKTQLITGFTLHTLFYFTSDIFGQDVQPCMQQIPVTHWIVKVLTHLKSSDQSLMTTSIADGPKTIQCFFFFFFYFKFNFFSKFTCFSLYCRSCQSPHTWWSLTREPSQPVSELSEVSEPPELTEMETQSRYLLPWTCLWSIWPSH